MKSETARRHRHVAAAAVDTVRASSGSTALATLYLMASYIDVCESCHTAPQNIWPVTLFKTKSTTDAVKQLDSNHIRSSAYG